jgi:nitrous oxidase accessory protein NosD
VDRRLETGGKGRDRGRGSAHHASTEAPMSRHLLLLLLLASIPLPAQDTRPTVVVDRDDIAITQSCRLVVAKPVVADLNGDGVIHIKASGIVVDFDAASTLSGADPTSRAPDELTGIGVRIDGQKDVTLNGFRIRGFKVGIYSSRADNLQINGADIADMFRQRLRSTPAAEDASDWLWPHENDKNEWMTTYGAAIYVEDSARGSIRRSGGRRSQNGILLDRVEVFQVLNNDFSFLSGWGLGLWRSSRVRVELNSFDFCIRGYSHGVYNRGQDSAGILMFEQCSHCRFAGNSVTHGGDGIFAFAGKEALGETTAPSKDFDYTGRGCNSNSFAHNDLSYAAAHGLELTFSFGNSIVANRIVGNAICGIWGGYSQHTQIMQNEIAENGDAGYGLERGGVNIEHGLRNVIAHNEFRKNRCGVHLWWSDNKDFPKKPWGLANYAGCAENLVVHNWFDGDGVAIHLRAAKDTTIAENEFKGVGRELDADAASTIVATGDRGRWQLLPPIESKTQFRARAHLRGRENIVMTEWGPWDHASPLVRATSTKGAEHVYTLHAFTKPAIRGVDGEVAARLDSSTNPPQIRVTAKRPGVVSYGVTVTNNPEGSETAFPVGGTIVSTKWEARFFRTSAKPHENAEAWKADSASGFTVGLDQLDLRFGGGGPLDALKQRAAFISPNQLALGISDLGGDAGSNHFGMVAETKIPLSRGKWKITTTSDDGVRVTADGKKIIDNWTWHVPTKDTGVLEIAEDRTVSLRVEYFELDGNAVLTFEIEKVQEK